MLYLRLIVHIIMYIMPGPRLHARQIRLHARQIPIYSILELSILPPGPLSLVGQSIISGGLHFSQGFTMVLLIGPNGRIREELKKSDVVQ